MCRQGEMNVEKTFSFQILTSSLLMMLKKKKEEDQQQPNSECIIALSLVLWGEGVVKLYMHRYQT